MAKLISKPDFKVSRCFQHHRGKLLEVFESFATTGFHLTPEREANIRDRIESEACHLCGQRLRQVHAEHYMSGDIAVNEKIIACEGCGNWIGFFETSISPAEYLVPFIRDFCPHSQVPSLTELLKEVRSTPERLFATNPRQFELFVGSVLSDFFNCEVYHVGKSRDGGIDLIVVAADQPLMIQVKRRQKLETVEGVDVVRLLFASMFIHGATHGMVVTTAQRFTRDAREWVHLPSLKDNSFQIDLVAFDRLLQMTKSVRIGDDAPPWTQAIPFWRAETPYIKELVRMRLNGAVTLQAASGASLSLQDYLVQRDGSKYWFGEGGCAFLATAAGTQRLFVFLDEDRSQCWELAPDVIDYDRLRDSSQIALKELLRTNTKGVKALGQSGFFEILQKAPVALIEEMIRRWAIAAGDGAETWDF